jgi:hypothetical protein
MMPELKHSARIALEDKDHPATNLGSWKCHIEKSVIRNKRSAAIRLDLEATSRTFQSLESSLQIYPEKLRTSTSLHARITVFILDPEPDEDQLR